MDVEQRQAGGPNKVITAPGIKVSTPHSALLLKKTIIEEEEKSQEERGVAKPKAGPWGPEVKT